MPDSDDALLREANRINYRLRSTFFYRKLKEYGSLALPGMVADLSRARHLYNWDHFADWGVGLEAFRSISARDDLAIIQVFCHPRVIREHPRLVAYYRNVAALSQKGARYLSGIDVKRLEATEAPEATLTEADAMALARLFNEHISLIIESSMRALTPAEVYGLLLVSTGAQIDGAWRNAIGEEAEQVVQRLLVKAASERGILAALVPRLGGPLEIFDPAQIDEQLGNIGRYKAFMLTNQTSVVFASEPDISLLNQDGKTVCVIEVKGGADPAARSNVTGPPRSRSRRPVAPAQQP